jgi:hypothetical protein
MSRLTAIVRSDCSSPDTSFVYREISMDNAGTPTRSKCGVYIALALFAGLFICVVSVGARLADHFLY